MKKLALIILAGASVAVLSLSAPQSVEAGKACARTEFKTKLIQNACKKDQKAAKKAMKKFVKEAKKASGEKVTCKTCHTKTSGKYPLKKEGLDLFKKWGGK